jgi:hypothetical protein
MYVTEKVEAKADLLNGVHSEYDVPQLTDNFGVGWVLEKLWHIIFGMDAV